MPIIRLFCDSGANIHSCRSQTVDTDKFFGLESGEWERMTEDERYELCSFWANERLEIGYEMVE